MVEMVYGRTDPVSDRSDTSAKITKDQTKGLMLQHFVKRITLKQPVRNSRPVAKVTATTEPVFSSSNNDIFYVFRFASPQDASMHRIHGVYGENFSDFSQYKDVKVIVDVYVNKYPNYDVAIIPNSNGAVYDFSKLYDDIKLATRHVYREKHRSISSTQKLPYSLDSGFIEVASGKFKDASVGSVVSEVEKLEKVVLKHSATHLEAPTILPHAMMLDDEATYAGSYHVWITLPHVRGTKFDHPKFIRDHSRAIVVLQWIEPLLLACMCPDTRAPGSGTEFSRASMRSKMNDLSGIGVAKMKLPDPQPILVHDSLADLNGGEVPKSRMLDAVWEVTKSGEWINVLACQSQDRGGERAAWNTMASGSVTNRGTDIRFDSCTGVEYRYMDGGAVAMVDKRAMLVRPAAGKYKITKESEFNPAGFEFRMFDHFPEGVAHELVSTVVTLSSLSYTQLAVDKLGDVQSRAEWVQQVSNASLYGSRGPVDAVYWSRLRKALGMRAATLPTTCYEALNVMLKDAFTQGKAKSASKKVLSAFKVSSAVTFPDANFEIWKASALSKMKKTQLAKLSKAGAKLSEDDVVKILGRGWALDTYALRALAANQSQR